MLLTIPSPVDALLPTTEQYEGTQVEVSLGERSTFSVLVLGEDSAVQSVMAIPNKAAATNHGRRHYRRFYGGGGGGIGGHRGSGGVGGAGGGASSWVPLTMAAAANVSNRNRFRTTPGRSAGKVGKSGHGNRTSVASSAVGKAEHASDPKQQQQQQQQNYTITRRTILRKLTPSKPAAAGVCTEAEITPSSSSSSTAAMSERDGPPPSTTNASIWDDATMSTTPTYTGGAACNDCTIHSMNRMADAMRPMSPIRKNRSSAFGEDRSHRTTRQHQHRHIRPSPSSELSRSAYCCRLPSSSSTTTTTPPTSVTIKRLPVGQLKSSANRSTTTTSTSSTVVRSGAGAAGQKSPQHQHRTITKMGIIATPSTNRKTVSEQQNDSVASSTKLTTTAATKASTSRHVSFQDTPVPDPTISPGQKKRAGTAASSNKSGVAALWQQRRAKGGKPDLVSMTASKVILRAILSPLPSPAHRKPQQQQYHRHQTRRIASAPAAAATVAATAVEL